MQAGARVAELARRGLEGFVESEKKFLDLAAKEVSEAIKETKRTGKPPRDRMKVFTEMTRDGAEKYMEAQKKLVDLAIEQMEKIGKGKGDHKEADAEAGAGVAGRTDGEERTQSGDGREVASGTGHEATEGNGQGREP